MAGTTIPSRICEDEQGGVECRGCLAPTRRCTFCGFTRGIAEPEQGFCKECQGHKGEESDRVSQNRHQGDEASVLEEFLGQINISPEGEPRPSLSRRDAPMELKRTPNPENFLQLLGEHIQERPDGTRLISAPLKVLEIRARLAPFEAQRVLQELASRGYLDLDSRLDAVRLRRDITAAVYDRAAQSQRLGFSQPEESRVSRRRRKPSNIPEPQQVFKALAARSRDANGSRIVRGAVPLLQAEFDLNAKDALSVLERLRESNLIVADDDWRVVTLNTGADP